MPRVDLTAAASGATSSHDDSLTTSMTFGRRRRASDVTAERQGPERAADC